jgi:DNA gyrase inhibitor GyrI/DNA-binding transcriptional ArsR family regulator
MGKLSHDTTLNETEKTLTENMEDIAVILGAIANQRRLKILVSLLAGERPFKALQEGSDLGKTALSHHLNLLVSSGVVNLKARGLYELSRDGRDMLQAVSDSYYESVRLRERLTAQRVDYLRVLHARKNVMSEIKVRIERLEPMRVVSFHAMGESPENDAVEKLIAWAQPRGLLENPDEHPVYGFNNPDPQEGQKEYGYEFWIKVGYAFRDNSASFKEHPGGKYAVTRVEVKDPWQDIPKAWMSLFEWVKGEGIEIKQDLCLEKTMEPGAKGEFVLELMLPLKD